MTQRMNLAAALHEAGARPAQPPAATEIDDGERPDPAPDSTTRPPSRVGLRAVTAYVKPEVHRQLRLLAFEQNLSVQELMIEAINELFHKHGKARIA